MKKLAILFPGIGYTMDRPLLYYCRKLAAGLGFESIPLSYTGFPSGVRGDRDKQLLCYEIARARTREQLTGLDWSAWDEILLAGKSIGTVIAAELACQRPERDRIRQILYTPLEDTFSVPVRNTVVFTGGADPWVGGPDSRIPALCAERSVPCRVIPGANHSLETGSVGEDLAILHQVMLETERFLRGAAAAGPQTGGSHESGTLGRER